MTGIARSSPVGQVSSSRVYFVVIAVTVVGVALWAWYVVGSPSASPVNHLSPIGEHGFAWGAPANATGSTPSGCPSAVGHYCYRIEIAGVPSGASVSNVALSLRNDSGLAMGWPSPPANDTVSLICPRVAGTCATYDTFAGGWTLNGSFSGVLGAGDSVAIYTAGTGAAYGLLGVQLVEQGIDGFSGTTVSNPFP